MRILLCTPYKQEPNVVSGGINIWGNNVWQFYQGMSPKDVEMDIVSYDRIYNVQEDSSVIKRVFYGIKDYSCAISRTKKKLKDGEHYDVLHLCTSAQLGLFKDYVVIREAHRRGVKVVLHLHFGRVPSMFEKGGFECRLFKKVAALADALIAIDPTTYNILLGHGFNNTYYLPNPLALNVIKKIEEERANVKRVPQKILYVGHIIPSKGVFELANACKEIDGIELHYVGSADEGVQKDIQTILQGGANEINFVFHGPVSHDEVIKEMLSSDVFVLPSYTEGFPNVILEAMACGCAIVATNVGAIPEMLEEMQDEHYGVIIEPKDVDGLREALCFMMNNEDYKDSCRNNVKERVNHRYAIPIVWRKLTEIWKQLL